MAVSPLSIDDFYPYDELVIEQMVEPVVMGFQELVKAGTVLLKLVSDQDMPIDPLANHRG